MKKLYLLLGCIALFGACRKSEIAPLPGQQINAAYSGKAQDPVIDINIKGHVPSGATLENGMAFRSVNDAIRQGKKSSIDVYKDSLWTSGFGRTLFVETDEIALMKNSAYERYIYAGSLLKGNSIADLNFTPLAEYQSAVKPITASVSFQAKKISGTINNVTLSGTRTFVNDLLSQNNVGDQVAGFSFSLDQFSAYDELKLAFGSNVKTNSLFSNKSNSTTETSVKISKRSGVYAKFVQKNFTLDLDIPAGGKMMNEGAINMTALNQQDPVYVSSITYGRMGIMAIESDYSYEETYNAYNSAFKAIFVKGSQSTTVQEKKIIAESTMKIYIIGSDGDGAVQTVNGYDAFIDFVSRGGKFSATQPGVPIYFSLSHLSDHSVVKTRFRLNIETDPVYARIEYENVRNYNYQQQGGYAYYSYADIYLHFYSDMMGTNHTIPPLFVKFEYKRIATSEGKASGPYDPYHEWNDTYKDSTTVVNTFKQTKILLKQNEIIVGQSVANYLEDYGSGGSGYVNTENYTTSDVNLKPGQFYKVLAPKK